MTSRHRGPFVRALLIGGLVTGISGMTAGTALATTMSSFASGVLTVTTDAAVTITCESESGALLVNGADVDTGRAYCETTHLVRVLGDAAVNTVDLGSVFADDFEKGASTQVQGNAGADVITGSELPDHVSGGIGADQILGGDGDDVLKGGVGADQLNGGAGYDQLFERADFNFALTDSTLTGLGADLLTSIETAKIAGGVSANTIDASLFTGPTVLSGGRGDDVLTGGPGDDLLRTSSGNDSLAGGDGADLLYAGNGEDSLNSVDAVGANDYLQGERGIDTCATDPGDHVWGCEL